MSRAVGHAGVLHRPGHAVRLHRDSLFALIALACVAALVIVFNPFAGSAPVQSSLFEATNGPHVFVSALPGVNLAPLERLPGLVATSGPYPGIQTSLRHGGKETALYLEARPRTLGAVDRPALASGRWVEPGGVVLSRKVAQQLELRFGDDVRIGTAAGPRKLRVAGIADTTAAVRYSVAPAAIEVGYALPQTLSTIAPNPRAYGETLLVRLADPGSSAKFAHWIERQYPGPQVLVRDWQQTP
jgi:hypothetical protein